MTSEMMFNANR
uniref:Uncharacterized protein n=1 Tax=Anguilla anguilla TaxID=7936 RepID=A0A0E9PX31_ANGAN